MHQEPVAHMMARRRRRDWETPHLMGQSPSTDGAWSPDSELSARQTLTHSPGPPRAEGSSHTVGSVCSHAAQFTSSTLQETGQL